MAKSASTQLRAIVDDVRKLESMVREADQALRAVRKVAQEMAGEVVGGHMAKDVHDYAIRLAAILSATGN